MDVMSLVWGTDGKRGRVKAKFGRKTKVCLPLALEETRRCTSSGCMGLVARSLFSCKIGSWQKVALSCHMALDMLCQEMHGAW